MLTPTERMFLEDYRRIVAENPNSLRSHRHRQIIQQLEDKDAGECLAIHRLGETLVLTHRYGSKVLSMHAIKDVDPALHVDLPSPWLLERIKAYLVENISDKA